MGRYLSWVANSVLFILCCYLLANAANEVFAALLTPSPAEGARSPAPGTTQRPAWSEREVIVKRNLFNASLLAPAAPVVVEEEPEEDLAATQLPLRLLGTAAINPQELSWAAVEDVTERRTLVVSMNDPLKNATVERIERRRIVLREGGELRELTLDEEETAGPSTRTFARRPLPKRAARAPNRRAIGRANPRNRTAPPRAPLPETVRKVDEDSFEVDRDDVEDLARDPNALFSQARILPKYDEGEMIGLQVNGIKPGSLFEEIGIESGDVITKLNGITIDDPQESAKVLSEFSEAESFTVDVERSDGSVDTLEFTVGDTE